MAASSVALIFCLGLAGPAAAHTRSLSYSKWDFNDTGATVFFRIALLELTRFEDGFPQPSYFAEHLRLLADGEQVPAIEALRVGGRWFCGSVALCVFSVPLRRGSVAGGAIKI